MRRDGPARRRDRDGRRPARRPGRGRTAERTLVFVQRRAPAAHRHVDHEDDRSVDDVRDGAAAARQRRPLLVGLRRPVERPAHRHRPPREAAAGHRRRRRGARHRPLRAASRATGRSAGSWCRLRDASARQRAEQDHAALISTVAHELRSPLTSVKGFTATLLRRWERFTDDQKRLHAGDDRGRRRPGDPADHRAARHLPASTPAGSRCGAQPVDLPAAGRPARRAARGQRQRPAAGSSSTAADDLPEVWADPDRLDQILANLMENAVRHGDGTVTMDVVPRRRCRPRRDPERSSRSRQRRGRGHRRRAPARWSSPGSGTARARRHRPRPLHRARPRRGPRRPDHASAARAGGGAEFRFTLAVGAPGAPASGHLDVRPRRPTRRGRPPAGPARIPGLAPTAGPPAVPASTRGTQRLTGPARRARSRPTRGSERDVRTQHPVRPRRGRRARPGRDRRRGREALAAFAAAGTPRRAQGRPDRPPGRPQRRSPWPTARSAPCRRAPRPRPASGSARPAAAVGRALAARQAELEAERDARVLVEEAVDVTLPVRPAPARRPAPAELTAGAAAWTPSSGWAGRSPRARRSSRSGSTSTPSTSARTTRPGRCRTPSSSTRPTAVSCCAPRPRRCRSARMLERDAADLRRRPGQGVPHRRARRHAHPGLPPDRGAGRRQGPDHGAPARHAGPLRRRDVRRRAPRTRLRPSYFPFTEPSAEIDIVVLRLPRRRPGLPHLRRLRLDRAGRLRHGQPQGAARPAASTRTSTAGSPSARHRADAAAAPRRRPTCATSSRATSGSAEQFGMEV